MLSKYSRNNTSTGYKTLTKAGTLLSTPSLSTEMNLWSKGSLITSISPCKSRINCKNRQQYYTIYPNNEAPYSCNHSYVEGCGRNVTVHIFTTSTNLQDDYGYGLMWSSLTTIIAYQLRIHYREHYIG